MDQRRHYQQRVQTLLDSIEERRRHQAVLTAHGVTPAGMRELEHELQGIRNELAAVLAAGS